MTPWAWLFLSGAWAIIIGNTLYCFWKLLSSDRGLEEHPDTHTP